MATCHSGRSSRRPLVDAMSPRPCPRKHAQSSPIARGILPTTLPNGVAGSFVARHHSMVWGAVQLARALIPGQLAAPLQSNSCWIQSGRSRPDLPLIPMTCAWPSFRNADCATQHNLPEQTPPRRRPRGEAPLQRALSLSLGRLFSAFRLWAHAERACTSAAPAASPADGRGNPRHRSLVRPSRPAKQGASCSQQASARTGARARAWLHPPTRTHPCEPSPPRGLRSQVGWRRCMSRSDLRANPQELGKVHN